MDATEAAMGRRRSRRDDFTFFQAGAEQMGRALAGCSERVVIYGQVHEFVAAQAGIAPQTFYTDPEVMVRAMLEAHADYKLDTPNMSADTYNIEAEALGQKLLYTSAGMPDIDRSAPLIGDKADLARIKTPDFDKAGRCAVVMQRHALFHKLTGMQPTLSFTAPFSLAANVRGIEQLLLDIYTDPEFARSLLERLTEDVLAPWILHQKQRWPQATSIPGADATASLPVVNLEILREWALPYILRLREICGPNVYVSNWVGERMLKAPQTMLEMKLAACPRYLQGQDPDVQELGPALYKDFAERNGVPLILGVGAAFLAAATPAEIAQRVRQYVEIGGRGGRFALYLCNIDGNTPPQNLRTAVEVAHSISPSQIG